MSKFKVGDKVKRISEVDIFKSNGGTEFIHEVSDVLGIEIKLNGVDYWWYNMNFELVVEWSIYNNTLPLSELSDEQRGLLFNHKCNGGNIEAKSAIGWLESSLWNMSWVYRAKQKTERELFIDEWSSKITTNEYNGGNVRLLVGQMFDDLNSGKEE